MTTNTTPSGADAQDERAAFERYYAQRHGIKPEADSNHYDSVLEAWRAWQARAALSAAQDAPPSLGDGARYRCRKCGEQNVIEFNYARIVTHRPDGSPRDPRDIATDPEGVLIHDFSQPLVAATQQDDDDNLSQAIDQRDTAEGWADGLAGLIGKYFGQEIGEHSSAHCPWQEARDIIEEALAAQAQEAAPATQEHSTVAANHKLYGGIVRAAINLLVACHEQHDTKPYPQCFGVPYGAVNALRDALEGNASAAPAAQGESSDPLQGAANWLLEAIDGCNIRTLEWHLKIGFNRAERLMRAARAAQHEGDGT